MSIFPSTRELLYTPLPRIYCSGRKREAGGRNLFSSWHHTQLDKLPMEPFICQDTFPLLESARCMRLKTCKRRWWVCASQHLSSPSRGLQCMVWFYWTCGFSRKSNQTDQTGKRRMAITVLTLTLPNDANCTALASLTPRLRTRVRKCIHL